MDGNRPKAPEIVEQMEMADKYYEYRASQKIQEIAEREEALHRDDDPVTLGLEWESVKLGDAAKPCPTTFTNNKVALESVLYTYQDDRDWWLTKCHTMKLKGNGKDGVDSVKILPPRSPSEREAARIVLFYEDHIRVVESALKLNRKQIMRYRRKHLPVVTGTPPLQMSGPMTVHSTPGVSQIRRQIAEMKERSNRTVIDVKPIKKAQKKQNEEKEKHKLKIIKG